MTIGERLTHIRNIKGWSQAYLARHAGIGQSTLHGYEAGTRSAEGMSVDVATRLARSLGVDLNYLCGFYSASYCSVPALRTRAESDCKEARSE